MQDSKLTKPESVAIAMASSANVETTMAAELTAQIKKSLKIKAIHAQVMAAVRMEMTYIPLKFSMEEVKMYVEQLKSEGFIYSITVIKENNSCYIKNQPVIILGTST